MGKFKTITSTSPLPCSTTNQDVPQPIGANLVQIISLVIHPSVSLALSISPSHTTPINKGYQINKLLQPALLRTKFQRSTAPKNSGVTDRLPTKSFQPLAPKPQSFQSISFHFLSHRVVSCPKSRDKTGTKSLTSPASSRTVNCWP